ncbi:50S ribosomal protein L6 [Candidatus Woesearchaeota archaeon]|nr:50S ribosomal protein L6 [Candidatus Woesearchaeota archaeon]
MKLDLNEEIALPAGVNAKLEAAVLKLKGPKGEVSRKFSYPRIELKLESGKVVVFSKKATKKEKMQMMTFVSHIRNLVQGVQEPHFYRLKICSGHFPMNVTVSGKEFIIKNFLGESVPRKITLPLGAEVKISGTEITVQSPDKELAGQIAAKIEQLCRITNRDRRVFQDGCYITKKAGDKN